MKKISLCMIVRNEELVIDRCLKSVKKLVDEIIVVDTGSTDKTKEIVKKYTDKIYDFVWCDDFSKARNYAFSFASGDYIMWLDADDVVPQKTINQLLKLKENMTADTYMLKYDIAFMNNKSTFSFYRERIVRNCSLSTWNGCVHECITPFGEIERLNLSIEHRKIKQTNSDRNYKIYKKVLKTRPLSPREQYYFGRELYDHKKYKECIKILNNFIESKKGWTPNIIDACYLISNCYLELNNEEKQLEYLFKTFNYSTPLSNICCKIGDYFFNKVNYELSIYWYLLAISKTFKTNLYGFSEELYKCYYPCLQLTVIYYKLGDIKKAEYYNNKANKHYSTEITKNNKIFFDSLKK